MTDTAIQIQNMNTRLLAIQELHARRQSIKNDTATFHCMCSRFIDIHLTGLSEFEPSDRLQYIVDNLTLYEETHVSYPPRKGIDFIVCCQENEVEELASYCKKCFPDYKVNYDNDHYSGRGCEIHITKIVSKEKLVEVQKKLAEKIKEFQTVNAEVLKLQEQQRELSEILGEK